MSTEPSDWSPENNIDEGATVGSHEFAVNHRKGIYGYWGTHPERHFVRMGQPGVHESWSVSLPHQCEEWEIGYAATRDEVAKQLEQFIADAQEALRVLREMPSG